MLKAYPEEASCFSAEILQPNPKADVIDACAAPGNKTLQLVSMLSNQATIFAIDRDPSRLVVLDRLSVVYDISSSTTAKHQNNTQSSQPSVQAYLADFLSLDPYDPQFSNVQSILLDPSCSGSGLSFRQPDGQHFEELQNRKPAGCNHGDDDVYNEEYSSRLKRLSNLQALLLKHALNFPNVQRVVYSTCSIHPEENEAVVRENADRVSDKFHLETIWPNTSSNVSSDSVTTTATTSPAWKRRGLSDEKYQCESCIRSSEEDLTTGFFVALFVRRKADKSLKKGSSSQPLPPSTSTTITTKTRTIKRTPVNCQSSFTTADDDNNKAEKEEKSNDDKQEKTFTFKVRKKCRKMPD
ncbi:unnamed protein product [Trichobilharzia regenti]|nr:unnamed protein product [Trichobilharzia regenti]